MAKKKVMLGMSGGVDSSVAAAVLLEKGYDVVGVTLKIWPDNDKASEKEGGCCSLSSVDDARCVAGKLGIPYYVLNFKDIFQNEVIDYFTKEYFRGRTPNPCIACNRHVKFDAMLKKAQAMGLDYVSTGHYALIEYDYQLKRYLLKKSRALKKDQTYALYNLTQYQLERTLMPLGCYTKDQIRRKAGRLGLPVASKPDSQEICFVPDDDYGRFISENADCRIRPGKFVDTKGNVLGDHKGIVHYTVGQRKGLGIAFGRPMYVVGIDARKNMVVLGEHDEVFSKGLVAGDVNYIYMDRLEKEMNVTVKIRYSAGEVPARLIPFMENSVKVLFETPQRAVTPGQSAVFYMNDAVIGGGIIDYPVND